MTWSRLRYIAHLAYLNVNFQKPLSDGALDVKSSNPAAQPCFLYHTSGLQSGLMGL
jgi:hypothetical protein